MDHPAIERAILLLGQALHPHARVEVPDAGEGRGPAAVVRLNDGSTLPLRFVTTAEDSAIDTRAHRVWVLSRAGKASHERLRRAGENFVDLRGGVHLSFPNLLVDRTGLRARHVHGAATPFDAFSDRSSFVVRTLLRPGDARKREWGVREIALASGVAPATATRVTRQLERDGVLHVARSGRNARLRLSDPAGLFTLWARRYDWTRNPALPFHAPVGDVRRFLRRLPALAGDTRWALALHAGAAQVAPHATWDRVHLYVDAPSAADLLRIGESWGWEPSPDGGVVLMKPYYRTSVWHGLQTIDALPVVSTLQLALDLWHYPLRGREQAEHLLQSVLNADD